MEEKLKELLSNEEYVKELVELRDPQKISDSLAEHDVDIPAKEVEKIISMLKKKADGELTDDELADVAGGFAIEYIIGICGFILWAAVGGAVAAKEC